MRTARLRFLPSAELIAQTPAPARDQSRLMVLDRASGRLAHRQFPDLLDYLRPGDVLVLNDSRVIPARLRGRNLRTGGKFEAAAPGGKCRQQLVGHGAPRQAGPPGRRQNWKYLTETARLSRPRHVSWKSTPRATAACNFPAWKIY